MKLLIINLLCLRHNHWLVVGGRSHGTDTEEPRRETASHRRGQSTIAVTIIIDTLEEREYAARKWLLRSETIPEGLNGNLQRC